MRHFMFIKAIYKIANIEIGEDKLLAAYNLAKRAAENSTLAQFHFCGIDWSVRSYSDALRVSLIIQETIAYSIYDGKEYAEPVLEINTLAK